MADEVTARYRWTLEEVKESNRWHRQALTGGFQHVQSIMLWVALPFFSLLDYALFSSHRGVQQSEKIPGAFPTLVRTIMPYFVLGIVVLIILTLILQVFFVPRQLRRIHASSSSRDADITWHVGPERLCIQEQHASAEMVWGIFIKAVQVPLGILLYSQPNLYYWLPKTGFASADDYDTVLAWIREKVPAVRKVD